MSIAYNNGVIKLEDDITPSGAFSAGFKGFSNAYLELLDGLKKRGYERGESSRLAMDLVVSYFNFTNNQKLASQGVSFTFEPEVE
jgi:hypothetical protein